VGAFKKTKVAAVAGEYNSKFPGHQAVEHSPLCVSCPGFNMGEINDNTLIYVRKFETFI
jgi:hypothetical protein